MNEQLKRGKMLRIQKYENWEENTRNKEKLWKQKLRKGQNRKQKEKNNE